jgi:hypothetical protein
MFTRAIFTALSSQQQTRFFIVFFTTNSFTLKSFEGETFSRFIFLLFAEFFREKLPQSLPLEECKNPPTHCEIPDMSLVLETISLN